jgi:glucose-6-phosphate 1-dehydrogenase
MKLGPRPSADKSLPCTFVIFGATGNLASNKLLPALYHLEAAGRLAESLSIIAFSRRDWTTDKLARAYARRARRQDQGLARYAGVRTFLARFSYFKGDLNDSPPIARWPSGCRPIGVLERGLLSRHQAG